MLINESVIINGKHQLPPIRKYESQTGKNGLYNRHICYEKFELTTLILISYE